MGKNIADQFIAEMSSTLRDYRVKTHTSRELEDLVDVSEHFLAALDAMRQAQSTKGASEPPRP